MVRGLKGYSPSCGGKAWQQEGEAAAAQIHSREAESCKCWVSARFLLFTCSETPAHEMVLPTISVGLSINLSRNFFINVSEGLSPG